MYPEVDEDQDEGGSRWVHGKGRDVARELLGGSLARAHESRQDLFQVGDEDD